MVKGLKRLSNAFAMEAPATTEMPLGMACCAVTALHGSETRWDKNILDPYPDEPGFSRRTRGILLLALPFASWGVLGAFVYAIRAIAGWAA